jgi:hypothetical protein
MTKLIRFAIFFLLIWIIFKGTISALKPATEPAEKLGAFIGMMLMFYLSFFIVKKYFRKY